MGCTLNVIHFLSQLSHRRYQGSMPKQDTTPAVSPLFFTHYRGTTTKSIQCRGITVKFVPTAVL